MKSFTMKPWKISLHVFLILISAKFVDCITVRQLKLKMDKSVLIKQWVFISFFSFLKINKKAVNAFSAYLAFLISPSVSEDFVSFLVLFVCLVGEVYPQHQKLAQFIRYFMTESNWQNFLSFPVRLFTSSRRVVMNGLYWVIN